MFEIKRQRRKPHVTTSSMSDIGFLLLIFIMLLSLMNQKYEAKIEYSEALNIEKTDDAHNLEIWVEKNGRVSCNNQFYDMAGLELLIASSILEHQDARIQIIADKETPYKYVNGIINVLQKLQYRVVSFVVQEKEDL